MYIRLLYMVNGELNDNLMRDEFLMLPAEARGEEVLDEAGFALQILGLSEIRNFLCARLVFQLCQDAPCLVSPVVRNNVVRSHL